MQILIEQQTRYVDVSGQNSRVVLFTDVKKLDINNTQFNMSSIIVDGEYFVSKSIKRFLINGKEVDLKKILINLDALIGSNKPSEESSKCFTFMQLLLEDINSSKQLVTNMQIGSLEASKNLATMVKSQIESDILKEATEVETPQLVKYDGIGFNESDKVELVESVEPVEPIVESVESVKPIEEVKKVQKRVTKKTKSKPRTKKK